MLISFLKKYRDIRIYLNYKDYEPISFLVNEINYVFATILYYIFLRLKINANGVDIISVIVIYLSAIFVFLDINILTILGLLFFVLVDVWDIVDGQIARAHNMESHKGYYFDLVAQAISHDVIIIVIA